MLKWWKQNIPKKIWLKAVELYDFKGKNAVKFNKYCCFIAKPYVFAGIIGFANCN